MVGNNKTHEHVFAFGYWDNNPSFSGVCKKRTLRFKPRGGSSLQPDEKNKMSLNSHQVRHHQYLEGNRTIRQNY